MGNNIIILKNKWSGMVVHMNMSRINGNKWNRFRIINTDIVRKIKDIDKIIE